MRAHRTQQLPPNPAPKADAAIAPSSRAVAYSYRATIRTSTEKLQRTEVTHWQKLCCGNRVAEMRHGQAVRPVHERGQLFVLVSGERLNAHVSQYVSPCAVMCTTSRRKRNTDRSNFRNNALAFVEELDEPPTERVQAEPPVNGCQGHPMNIEVARIRRRHILVQCSRGVHHLLCAQQASHPSAQTQTQTHTCTKRQLRWIEGFTFSLFSSGGPCGPKCLPSSSSSMRVMMLYATS